MCTHIEFVGIWGLLSHEVRENGIDKGWKFGTLNLTEWIHLFLRLFILPLLNIEKLLNKAAEKILPTYFSIPWNCHFNCNAWRECLGQKKRRFRFTIDVAIILLLFTERSIIIVNRERRRACILPERADKHLFTSCKSLLHFLITLSLDAAGAATTDTKCCCLL